MAHKPYKYVSILTGKIDTYFINGFCMDSDIYALVAKYGFKNLHIRLVEIMREEYRYFQTQFETVPPVKQVIAQVSPVSKKVKKTRVKSPVATSEVKETQDVKLSLENVEMKDVIVTVNEKIYRDPKEMKEYQKNAVEARKKENDAAGLTPADFLTKDNLKLWIEDEGKTYAWVAREKSGCPETQVAATAQMMGIKSKISRIKGRIMSGN